MTIAKMFIDQGFPTSIVLNCCDINKSSFYYKPIVNYKPKGIGVSTHTLTIKGTLITNEAVVEDIKLLLQEEFCRLWLHQNNSLFTRHQRLYN